LIECDKFHETKRERRYYDDKKVDALDLIYGVIDDMNSADIQEWETQKRYWLSEIQKIKKLVKDI